MSALGLPSYGYDAELLARIRARYEGRDVGSDQGERLVGDAMAEEFGVHPNSIYAWAKRFTWRRPGWYLQKRPFRKKRRRNTAAGLRSDVHKTLQAIAAAGAPCPTNIELALQLGCSAGGIVDALRELVAMGLVTSEIHGPARRLTLAEGRTAWTALATLPPKTMRPELRVARRLVYRIVPPPGLEPGALAHERRSQRDAKLLDRLRQAADAGEAFPSDAVLGALVDVPKRSVWDLLKRLEDAGHLRMERSPNKRSAVLRCGRRVPWSHTPPPTRRGQATGIDIAAREAVRALQRMGKVTFDVAVVSGRAWGVTWSVDGRLLGRDDLIADARARCAAALQQLREVAP